MFIRILNSEMELATGCTEPGAVALTAAEAGQALRKAGVDKAEEITVNASINIIKNAIEAGARSIDLRIADDEGTYHNSDNGKSVTRLLISNDGQRIAPEVAREIFSPSRLQLCELAVAVYKCRQTEACVVDGAHSLFERSVLDERRGYISLCDALDGSPRVHNLVS